MEETDTGVEDATATEAQAALDRATAEQDALDAQENGGVENSGQAAVPPAASAAGLHTVNTGVPTKSAEVLAAEAIAELVDYSTMTEAMAFYVTKCDKPLNGVHSQRYARNLRNTMKSVLIFAAVIV